MRQGALVALFSAKYTTILSLSISLSLSHTHTHTQVIHFFSDITYTMKLPKLTRKTIEKVFKNRWCGSHPTSGRTFMYGCMCVCTYNHSTKNKTAKASLANAKSDVKTSGLVNFKYSSVVVLSLVRPRSLMTKSLWCSLKRGGWNFNTYNANP